MYTGLLQSWRRWDCKEVLQNSRNSTFPLPSLVCGRLSGRRAINVAEEMVGSPQSVRSMLWLFSQTCEVFWNLDEPISDVCVARAAWRPIDLEQSPKVNIYAESIASTSQLSTLILEGQAELKIDEQKHKDIRTQILADRKSRLKTEADRIYDTLDPKSQRAMELAQLPGGSCLITTLPLERYGFNFSSKETSETSSE